VAFYWISALAPAYPQSGHFAEIRPSSAKFLAGFARFGKMPVKLPYVQLIMDKTNTADLLSGVFAFLISVTRTIKNTKFVAVTILQSKSFK